MEFNSSWTAGDMQRHCEQWYSPGQQVYLIACGRVLGTHGTNPIPWPTRMLDVPGISKDELWSGGRLRLEMIDRSKCSPMSMDDDDHAAGSDAAADATAAAHSNDPASGNGEGGGGGGNGEGDPAVCQIVFALSNAFAEPSGTLADDLGHSVVTELTSRGLSLHDLSAVYRAGRSLLPALSSQLCNFVAKHMDLGLSASIVTRSLLDRDATTVSVPLHPAARRTNYTFADG